MLPCIKKNETNNTYDIYTYPTLSGHMATHFPVYMTLGMKHLTGLPFFGFANIYMNIPGRGRIPCAPMIKPPFHSMITREISYINKQHFLNYSETHSYFSTLNKENLIKKEMFIDMKQINDSEKSGVISDIIGRIGSLEFMNTIIIYNAYIQDYVQKLAKGNMPMKPLNLFDLHYRIGANNMFGVSLAEVSTTFTILQDIKFHHMDVINNTTISKYDKYIGLENFSERDTFLNNLNTLKQQKDTNNKSYIDYFIKITAPPFGLILEKASQLYTYKLKKYFQKQPNLKTDQPSTGGRLESDIDRYYRIKRDYIKSKFYV